MPVLKKLTVNKNIIFCSDCRCVEILDLSYGKINLDFFV